MGLGWKGVGKEVGGTWSAEQKVGSWGGIGSEVGKRREKKGNYKGEGEGWFSWKRKKL